MKWGKMSTTPIYDNMKYDNHIMVLLILAMPFLFLIGCSDEPQRIVHGELKKAKHVVINDSLDQIANIMEGLQAVEGKGLLYGIDFRTRRPFKISVKTGDVEFLSSKGRGPKELSLPSQLTLKNEEEFFVYDTSQDKYAHFLNDEIVNKYPGLLEQRIWLRHTYGEYWRDYLITSVVEPEKVNRMDFDEARALSFYNIKEQKAELKAKLSPTIDHLDNAYKFPIIALDNESESVFYVFSTDFTVMKYDLNNDSTSVFSSYKSSQMRSRSLSVNHNQTPSRESAKEFGLDISKLVGLEILDSKLVVVWQNGTEEYYEEPGASNKLREYFGVVYDLNGQKSPIEINLPGKLLGSYNEQLLIEENDDLDAYTIGFYEIFSLDSSLD